jgi:hypothetical protein
LQRFAKQLHDELAAFPDSLMFSPRSLTMVITFALLGCIGFTAWQQGICPGRDGAK